MKQNQVFDENTVVAKQRQSQEFHESKDVSSSARKRRVTQPMTKDMTHKQVTELNPYQRQYRIKHKNKRINEQDDYFDMLRNDFPNIIEKQQDDIDRMEFNCLNDAKSKPNYEISSDDCVENATVFEFLLYKQRMRHMEALWRKVYVKAKAAGQFVKFIRDIQDKIYLLGISFNIKDQKFKQNIPCLIIPPDHKFSQIWSLVIAVLLIYTATYMPYKTCFVDESTFVDNCIDWTVDVLFMFDILVNFLQATENSDGSIICNPKIIARNYIRSWFAFDLVSVIPFQLIEVVLEQDTGGDASSYNQLIRLARLPRLYRMTKLMRLVKVIKSAKKIKFVQKLLKSVKVNSAISRMIQGMITAVLLTHIFACFWFLTAKFDNFQEDTWVARLGIRQKEPIDHYIWALYWSCQTITTVGYGDIPAFTNVEVIFSFVWMLVGVAFYSFIIGNFSSIITGSSQIQKTIQYRIKGLSELARKAKIPFDTSKQIKQYIEQNVMAFITQDEDQQLIQTLPPCLRDEILLITYGEMIDRINFLGTVEDHEFMWKLLKGLQDIKFAKGDVLYWRGDDADSMYFILSGKIKLYTDGNPFVKYQNGECFGDQDMLLNLPRDSKAVAITHLHLKALTGEMFEKISQSAQETCLKMIVEARKKRDKHFYLIKKLNERLSRKNIIISEMSQHAEKLGTLTSSPKSRSMIVNYSPLQKQGSIRDVSPQSASFLKRKTLGKQSPQLVRAASEQHLITQKNQLMNFKMNPMETIQESENQSQNSQDKSPNSQSNQKVPQEFRNPNDNGTRSRSLPKQKDKQRRVGNFFSASVDQVLIPMNDKKKKQANVAAKRMTRRHAEMDERLKHLAFMNNNSKVDQKISDHAIQSSGLMDKFWKNQVTELPVQAYIPEVYEKTNSESSVSQKNQSRDIEAELDKLNDNCTTPEKDSVLVLGLSPDAQEKNSRGSGSKGKAKSSMRGEKNSNGKRPKLYRNLTVDTLPTESNTLQYKQSNDKANFETFQSAAHPHLQHSNTMAPKSPNIRKSITNLNSINNSKRTSFRYSAVGQRVGLDNAKLNQALITSSRVKHAHKERSIQLLSQRIQRQTMDQLGNKTSMIGRFDSQRQSQNEGNLSPFESQHPSDMNEKLEALQKLELEEIEEDDEDSEDEQIAANKRRTLLDKVVGDVFGKNKQSLYEMFPSLAVITVPKMPIITPKGDEIILRKKYNNNMNLLNEAFEQKQQIYDEDTSADMSALMPHNEPSSPELTPQTRKSRQSIPSQKRSIQNQQRQRLNSDETVEQEKVQIDTKKRQRPQSSLSKLATQTKNIEVRIDEVGEEKNERKILKRKYTTDKHNMDSPKTSGKLEVHNESTGRRSKSSSAVSSIGINSKNKRNHEFDAKFLKLDGKRKSSVELRNEFVSPQVMNQLRDASKHIGSSQEKKMKKEDSNDKYSSGNKEKRTPSGKKKQKEKLAQITLDIGQIKVTSFSPNTPQIESIEESKEDQSKLVSIDDSQMSEVLSSNADVQKTGPSFRSSKKSDVSKDDLDVAHRLEILQLLKEFIDNDAGTHRSSARSREVIGMYSQEAGKKLDAKDSNRGKNSQRIEFLGNESMKSIVRFNLDAYLIGLNTFETISMFDHVQQAMTGMKKKLNKASQHIDNIEKKQNKLDSNADKMIDKMKAYRELKSEVANLNKAQRERKTSANQPRARNLRKGQLKMNIRQASGQQNPVCTTVTNTNTNTMMNTNMIQRQESQKETLELSVINDIPENISLPINQTGESSAQLVYNEVQINQTFPKGIPIRQKQQQSQNIAVKNRNNLISEIEGMEADRIVRLINGPLQNL